MIVTVKVGGPLRKKVAGLKDGELSLDLAQGTTLTGALNHLNLTLEDVRVIMLNGRPVERDETLKENDRLALFPPALAYNMYVAINFHNRLLNSRENKT